MTSRVYPENLTREQHQNREVTVAAKIMIIILIVLGFI
jgi:hypothetical protein